MNELDMCKAMAKLEGVIGDNINWEIADNSFLWIGNLTKVYNPITDLALNCELRDKYCVNVNHYIEFDCGIDGNGSFDLPCCNVSIDGKYYVMLMNVNYSGIRKAVIKCILKSKGLFNG